MERQINFYLMLYNHKSNYIRDFIKNVFMYQSSYTVSNVYKFVNKFNVPFCDLFKMKKCDIRNVINQSYSNIDWKVPIIKELLNILDGQMEVEMGREEIMFILNTICTDR